MSNAIYLHVQIADTFTAYFVVVFFGGGGWSGGGNMSHGIDTLKLISDCSTAKAMMKINFVKLEFVIQFANFLPLSEVSS